LNLSRAAEPDPDGPTVLTELQGAAAGMIGRGKPLKAVALVLGVSPRTVTRWRGDDDFQAEESRVRDSAGKPNPQGTLLDALSARRDDQVDWVARLNAAKQMLALGLGQDDDEKPDALPAGARTVTIFAEATT